MDVMFYNTENLKKFVVPNFTRSIWTVEHGPVMLYDTRPWKGIDTVGNLVFWSRFVNKLEPWHIVYIMQQ